ncbi:hypothetical protein [Herbiconiux ginsengi]|uniref:O-antigen ligase n=1 Tax=Herbiconiux ginsengi TaxID=381665 RepID=A0A1H3SP18_9MICO|nr:hypothetical protein [Herbiconiux ginsengi]SDZ39281.1 hypothetical protein SAMN05216554_3509 [Herbiconiux ginsengi]
MQFITGIALALGFVGSLLAPVRYRIGIAVIGGLAILIFVVPGSLGFGPLGAADSIIVAAAWMTALSLSTLRPLRFDRLFALYIVVVLLGSIGAIITTGEVGFPVLVALSGIVFVVVCGTLSREEWLIVRVGATVLAALVAVLCLVEAFAINRPLFVATPFGLSPLFPESIRAQATLGHPLVAAMVMLIGIGFTLTLRFRVGSKLLVVALLAAGVISTGSTSAIIAAAFTVIAGFIVSGGSNSRIARVGLAGVVVFFVATLSLVPSGLLADVSNQNSVHRANSFLAIPRLFTSRSPVEALFGTGWGSEELMYQRNVLINDNFFAIDNQFTTVIVVAGGIGIVCFLAFIIGLLLKSRGSARVTLLALVLMFLSFDVLNWAATSALFITFASFALFKQVRPRDGEPVALPNARESLSQRVR